MLKYKFETKKEILDAFRKIKKFIEKGIPRDCYSSYIGKEELVQKIFFSFNCLFYINKIHEVADIVSKYYDINLSHTHYSDWEEKLLKIYNECHSGNGLEIE